VKEHDGILFTGGMKKTVAHRGPAADHAGDSIETLYLVEDKRLLLMELECPPVVVRGLTETSSIEKSQVAIKSTGLRTVFVASKYSIMGTPGL
jgi:hypothetical protein